MIQLPAILCHPVYAWGGVVMALGGYLGWLFFAAEDKTDLLPGITTSGHHQIEQRCDVCHDQEADANRFSRSGVSNEACLSCHRQDLELANDSHPVIKFKNPENAVFLEHINAMACVTCHTEHVEDRTGAMAVTLPPDYCAHCHESTLENRASHQGLAFQTCETAGCHNFHDNTALFESFLIDHGKDPDLLPAPSVPDLDPLYRWIAAAGTGETAMAATAETVPAADAPAEVLERSGAHLGDWMETAHARAGINCSDCHTDPGAASNGGWVERPGAESCKGCHAIEHEDFGHGKHGMKLAAGLGAMTPGEARLPMKKEAAHRSLSCVSCHGAHRFDRQFAAASACLECHDDAHSRSFDASPHGQLWRGELAGDIAAGAGVSCASCHLPREERTDPATGERTMVVQHNQNANLTPNEKMYRGVCLHCHGLPFTMDSLADRTLIERNFAGPPSVHVESIDWALDAAAGRERDRQRRETEQETPDADTGQKEGNTEAQ